MAEMEELKRYIIEMKAEMVANGSKLNSIHNDVGLMRTTIIGIPETNRPGMIHDIADMKEKINGHDKEIKDIKDKHFKEKVIIGTGSAAVGATMAATTHPTIIGKVIAGLASLFKY